jgi:serine protease Do
MGRRSVAAILAVSLAFSACGGDTASTPPSSVPTPTATDQPGPTASSAAAPSATPGADLLVSSIPDLPGAVVQIARDARYRDPVEGWREGIVHGSGFIIDPTGIILTNHHVVSEADTVTAFVGEDRTEYQGRVVSVAECSDLAVVQLEGGGAFPWLDWFDGTIETGVDVFAAGFPRGDPVYTLTGGIISRLEGVISEQWAWVDKTI